MKLIKVGLKDRAYNIVAGYGILPSLGKYLRKLNLGSAAYVVTNAPVKKRYAGILKASLEKYGILVKFKLMPDTEKSKSLACAYSIIKDLTAFDKKRRIFIIALGGGVVGDLSGFVASVYKRGTPYIQVPTTLLAQVDSAIGGKTAVDLAAGKNLIGVFYQPRLVFSDAKVLKTLSLRQIRAGLAEVIKYAAIKDPALFRYLEKKYKSILALDPGSLKFIISRCSAIKAKIVEQDEKETKGVRTVLNFGHTLGHAIEAASGYRGYNHGESVALGMLLACDISRRAGLSDSAVCQRMERLVRNIGLPAHIGKLPLSRIIKAHYRDKKFRGAKNRFVLLRAVGKTKITENIPLKMIEEALKDRRP
ncbi:MAG: 3-dehydroquinate synthase [Candidatus Omnitrophica bacterium]|nr:3-dehydroquinate synthase [Candidatus Omnitrophota bacterium]